MECTAETLLADEESVLHELHAMLLSSTAEMCLLLCLNMVSGSCLRSVRNLVQRERAITLTPSLICKGKALAHYLPYGTIICFWIFSTLAVFQHLLENLDISELVEIENAFEWLRNLYC